MSGKPLAAVVEWIDWVIAAGALALAGWGQHLFAAGQMARAVLLMGAAMILFAWAVRRLPAAEPATAPLAPVPPARRLAGLVLLGLSILCTVLALWRFGTHAPDNAGWALYLASMALFLLAFLVMEGLPNRESVRRWAGQAREMRWELFLLFVLVAAGGVLRFYGVEGLPYGVWFDESDNAVWAREILTRPDFRPLYVASTNLPAHFLYLIALSFRLFGVNAGALRMVTAFFGTATILGMWLLGREIGGHWVGLLAAAMVAVSHWCINFSRLGMHGITTPFFAVLAAYWLLKGLRTGSRRRLAAGGLMLGLGLCFYAPFRLFPFVIVLFLAAKALLERGFLRRGWQGVLIYVLASLIAFAPIGQYAWVHRDEFFARTKQTSLFTGKTREQAIEALQSNIRKHLLMFNYQGDRNGRHNLPGEPMLDAVTGALLPLGAAYVLARLHRPRQLLIAGWFGIMLCGGILSLDFEAPQSLRSIGTIPAVFLMTALAVPAAADVLLRPLRRLNRPALERAAGALLAVGVVAGLAYSAYLNFDIYFVRQPRHPDVFHSYNAREAFTARMVAAHQDEYIFYSIYVGHPTVRFLAPDAPYHRSFQPLDDLPVRGLVDRDVLYVMEPEFCPPPELFAVWYPNGQIRWYNDPSGAPMLFVYQVSKDEVNAMQGVWLKLYGADGALLKEERVDTLAGRWDDWAGIGPARGEWSGQVFIPYSGVYTFVLRSTGTASLMLDDQPIQLPDGGEVSEERLLVKGWHPIRLVADAAAGGEVRVDWAPPNGQPQPIPREALNILPGLQNGLYGYYYQGLEWSGVPVFGRVDWQVNFRWHIQPLPAPFSVEWFGGLKIDQAGTYLIAIDSNSDALVELNGEVILDSMQAPHGYHGVNVYLEPGVYPIHVRYREPGGYTMMRLQWHPPGGQFEAIPAQHLVPKVPEGALPAFTMTEQAPAPAVETPPAVAMEDVEEVSAKLLAAWPVARWLQEPRYIAVGPQGDVFVSDAGKKAVAVFDAGGRFRAWWGEGLLQDPSDLAPAPDGGLYVMDAGRSRLVRFDANGKPAGELGETAGLYGSRGLAWTPTGELAIADTGSNRIVILSTSGELVRSFGTQGAGIGQLDQPADLAVAPDGSIFVADTLLNKRLQVFSGEGTVLRQWAVPWASDFLAPAMAIAPQGRLYMADPDRGRVWEYAQDGSTVVWWAGGNMRRPVGLAVDAAGRIYVLDGETRTIYIFERTE